MKRLITSLGLGVVVALSGCGGHHQHKHPPPASAKNLSKPHPEGCKPGQGHLGCSVPHQLGFNPKLFTLPKNEGLIPDVFEGNTVSSWAQAKPHIVGAIVKAYEFRPDSKFVTNWNTLRSLKIWHTAYLFLHSCSEASAYVNLVNSVGGFNQPNTGPPVIDAEVPEAGPALQCAVSTIEHMTHRRVVEYTSPGSNPGGSRGDAIEWSAGYGNYSHCPFVWTGNCIAWQYTDGIFGPFPHQIPGIQPGDISVSYGFQRLVPSAPPAPAIKCLAKNWPHTTHCRKVRYVYNKIKLDLAKVRLRQRQHHCSARKHPTYCRGWVHAQQVDTKKLATFNRYR